MLNETKIAMAFSLQAAKQQVREAMKQKLTALSSESISQQSSVVVNALKEFEPYVRARRISIFLSMPTGEISTDAIVRHAIQSGKEVYVPYLHKNPFPGPPFPTLIMDMVRLNDMTDYETLQPDKWGIPSIDPSTASQRYRILGDLVELGDDATTAYSKVNPTLLDLILVPGVAFALNPEGTGGPVRRLGHGKGFYDLFIQRHASKIASLGSCDSSSVKVYGLALQEQFIAPSDRHGVPVGPLDQALEGLILGSGEIMPHPPAASNQF